MLSLSSKYQACLSSQLIGAKLLCLPTHGVYQDDVQLTAENNKVRPTLGEYLASIRKDRKMTLREVEQASSKQVSNAYLSQIENDKIRKPSPNVLHSLAETYAISFENLMDKAGYLMSFTDTTYEYSHRHNRVSTFDEYNLTPDEESELLQYLQFLRSRGRTRDNT